MTDWPHAPVHRFGDAGVYFVTGSTLYREHYFRGSRTLDALQELLFEKAREHAIELQRGVSFPITTTSSPPLIKDLA